ncbi:MAG TPA: TonB-dependent receptor plug domain-containing protein [Gemmatimonadaceae bacterium]|nr:TonB-dependent receptor plug domain-containing protein [Gemmatimonadaceae bacterium]
MTAPHVRRRIAPLAFAAALAAATLAAVAACRQSTPAAPPPPPEDSGSDVDVGYGSQPRKETTGAISSLDDDDVKKSQATRIDELLAGRVAGVRVTRTATGVSVRIRGAGDFTGGGEPLYIVDGTPVYVGPDGMLPVAAADVSRVEVLKDAGATAIYGSRGGNGVILIKTKRK